MRILLLRLSSNDNETQFGMKQMNLGIAYIKSYLNKNGYNDVTILDTYYHNTEINEVFNKIRVGRFDIIGFSILFRNMIPDAKKLIEKIRFEGIKSHITMGGHFPSYEYKMILRDIDGLDSIIRFEGEESFLQLARNLKSNNLSNIQNLVFKQQKELIINPISHAIKKLDNIPWPDRSVLNKSEKHKYITVLSSRGCYANCSFCSTNSFYKAMDSYAFRCRSPIDIVEELEFILSNFQTNKIAFIDDNFIGPGKSSINRALKISKLIEERELNIDFSISTRINDGNDEVYASLAKTGLVKVFFGIESGSNSVLKHYNKLSTVEENIKAIKNLKNLGINVEMGFMFFYPLLTKEEAMENITFFKEIADVIHLSIYNFSKLDVLNGTPLEKIYLGSNVVCKDNFSYEKGYVYEFESKEIKVFYYLIEKIKANVLNDEAVTNKTVQIALSTFLSDKKANKNSSLTILLYDAIETRNRHFIAIFEGVLQKCFLPNDESRDFLINEVSDDIKDIDKELLLKINMLHSIAGKPLLDFETLGIKYA